MAKYLVVAEVSFVVDDDEFDPDIKIVDNIYYACKFKLPSDIELEEINHFEVHRG